MDVDNMDEQDFGDLPRLKKERKKHVNKKIGRERTGRGATMEQSGLTHSDTIKSYAPMIARREERNLGTRSKEHRCLKGRGEYDYYFMKKCKAQEYIYT